MVKFNEKDKEYLEGQIEGLLNEIKTKNPYGSSLHYLKEKITKINNTIEEYNLNKAKKVEVYEIKDVGINEIWLHAKIEKKEFSGCLTEIEN